MKLCSVQSEAQTSKQASVNHALWIIENATTSMNLTSITYILADGMYTKGSLHSPSLLIVSAPLTLKEYSTPICSVSVMCCDVVVLVKLMLVAVTST